MSRVLPILFNTEMVRAILDGRKTVTRRLVKPRSKNACGFHVTFRKSDNAFMGVYDYDENEKQFDNSQTPPCQPGDILYVRETVWQQSVKTLDVMTGETDFFDINSFRYCATDTEPIIDEYSHWRKRPSIHMPKEATRIWLKVTDVRVERLKDITDEGILKEGLDGFVFEGEDVGLPIIAKNRFVRLWNSTLKKSDLDRYGWDASPWVWVIEFERCEKPESEG